MSSSRNKKRSSGGSKGATPGGNSGAGEPGDEGLGPSSQASSVARELTGRELRELIAEEVKKAGRAIKTAPSPVRPVPDEVGDEDEDEPVAEPPKKKTKAQEFKGVDLFRAGLGQDDEEGGDENERRTMTQKDVETFYNTRITFLPQSTGNRTKADVRRYAVLMWGMANIYAQEKKANNAALKAGKPLAYRSQAVEFAMGMINELMTGLLEFSGPNSTADNLSARIATLEAKFTTEAARFGPTVANIARSWQPVPGVGETQGRYAARKPAVAAAAAGEVNAETKAYLLAHGMGVHPNLPAGITVEQLQQAAQLSALNILNQQGQAYHGMNGGVYGSPMVQQPAFGMQPRANSYGAAPAMGPPQANLRGGYQGTNQGAPTCHACGKVGHIMRYCQSQNGQAAQSQPQQNGGAAVSSRVAVAASAAAAAAVAACAVASMRPKSLEPQSAHALPPLLHVLLQSVTVSRRC